MTSSSVGGFAGTSRRRDGLYSLSGHTGPNRKQPAKVAGVTLEPIKKKGVTRRKAKPAPAAAAEAPIGEDKPDERPFIVGIGASAGGLEALRQLLPNLPKHLGLSYVVVQHLSPTYRSMMAQLLGRETTMPVRDIEDGTLPETNTV